MIKELKPCPKCGSDNGQAVGRVRSANRFTSASDYFVRCDDCGFVVRGYITEEAAIAAWNELEREKDES